MANSVVSHFTNLLILQYQGSPKAMATLNHLVSMAVADCLPLELRNAYDPETATGMQLDTIGKYYGLTRTSGGVEITEEQFRVALFLAGAKNTMKITNASVQSLLFMLREMGVEGAKLDLRFYDTKRNAVGYIVNTRATEPSFINYIIANNLIPYPIAIMRLALIYTDFIGLQFSFATYLEGITDDILGYNTYNEQVEGEYINYSNIERVA